MPHVCCGYVGIGADGRAKKEGVSALLGAMSHFADSLELQVAGCKIVATRNNLCKVFFYFYYCDLGNRSPILCCLYQLPYCRRRRS